MVSFTLIMTFEETLTSNTEEKRRRRKMKQQEGHKTLPSSAPPVERTVIQELAFPATAEDVSSARQFHCLTRPMKFVQNFMASTLVNEGCLFTRVMLSYQQISKLKCSKNKINQETIFSVVYRSLSILSCQAGLVFIVFCPKILRG